MSEDGTVVGESVMAGRGYYSAHSRPQHAAASEVYRQGHDAAAFAHGYVAFVRAVTEHPFFRWLDADRTPTERADLVERFYRRLEGALVDHPEAAAVWHVFSLRLRRRPR